MSLTWTPKSILKLRASEISNHLVKIKLGGKQNRSGCLSEQFLSTSNPRREGSLSSLGPAIHPPAPSCDCIMELLGPLQLQEVWSYTFHIRLDLREGVAKMWILNPHVESDQDPIPAASCPRGWQASSPRSTEGHASVLTAVCTQSFIRQTLSALCQMPDTEHLGAQAPQRGAGYRPVLEGPAF